MINAIIWEVSPIAFEIGGRFFLWYSLLFASGLWIAYFILRYLFSLENIDSEKVSYMWIYGAISAVVGARLFEVLFYNPTYFSEHPSEILQFWKGGLSSHGGTFALVVFIWAFAKWNLKKSFFWLGDRGVAAITAGAICIRIGNLCNSEIVGTPTNLPWAFIFKAKDEIPRHPIQLYEAIAYLILLGILFFMLKKGVHLRSEGKVGGVFLLGMFGTRFLLEFTKANNSALISDASFLSMGQILSFPLVLFALWILFWKK